MLCFEESKAKYYRECHSQNSNPGFKWKSYNFLPAPPPQSPPPVAQNKRQPLFTPLFLIHELPVLAISIYFHLFRCFVSLFLTNGIDIFYRTPATLISSQQHLIDVTCSCTYQTKRKKKNPVCFHVAIATGSPCFHIHCCRDLTLRGWREAYFRSISYPLAYSIAFQMELKN